MDTHWSIRKFLKRYARGLRRAGSVALRAFAIADSESPFPQATHLEGDRVALIKERGISKLIEGIVGGLKERLGGFFGKERLG